MSSKHRSVAIIGPGNIGKIHAQRFNHLGIRVGGIVSTSIGSAQKTSVFLEQQLGYAIPYYQDFNQMIENENPDFISICTPPDSHEQFIELSFSHNKPVLCEKPLFWYDSLNSEIVKKKLEYIKENPNRFLFMNISNEIFIKEALKMIPDEIKIDHFSFSFHTHGNYRGKEIGFDLLPHGISLLTELFGDRKVAAIDKKIKPQKYICSFKYGKCDVIFDFRQDKTMPKKLSFKLNAVQFYREQELIEGKFKVFLYSPDLNQRIEIKNPLDQKILCFIRNFENSGDDEFEKIMLNMNLLQSLYTG